MTTTYEDYLQTSDNPNAQFVIDFIHNFIDIELDPNNLAESGVSVEKDELRDGDLVFFSNKENKQIVGIYQANSFVYLGKAGVTAAKMDSEYWSPRFLFARRVA